MQDIRQTWGGFSQKQKNKTALRKLFPEISTMPIDGSLPYRLPQKQMDFCVTCRYKEAKGFLMECEHQSICLGCAEEFLSVNLQLNKDSICPIPHCQKGVSKKKESFLYKLSSKTQEKFKVYEYKKKLGSLGNIHNCQRPDCEGIVNPDNMLCILCKERHCHKCYRLAHEDECLLISHNLLGVTDLKACKKCRMNIFKDGGCSKIICPNCQGEFCYECMEEWEFKHYGCSKYGWLSPIFFFFEESCCSSNNIDKQYQIIVHSAKRETMQEE